MSTPDIVILICFVPAIVRGIQRGFIAQVVSLLSVILGIYLAFQFSEMACAALQGHFPDISPTVMHIIAFVLILAVVALLLHLVGKLILEIFKAVDLGWINWILGIVFSLLKAALIIGLAIILFDTLNGKFSLVSEETLSSSVLYEPLRDAGYKVFPYLKAIFTKQ